MGKDLREKIEEKRKLVLIFRDFNCGRVYYRCALQRARLSLSHLSLPHLSLSPSSLSSLVARREREAFDIHIKVSVTAIS